MDQILKPGNICSALNAETVCNKEDQLAVIGIIGGAGQMGSWFARLFEQTGHRVIISDTAGGVTKAELVRSCDIVIISVPIRVSESVAREVVPLMKPNQLLLDLTSLKLGIADILSGAASEALSLHPMFGPHYTDMRGQTVVVCPVNRGVLADSFIDFLRARGARIKTCDASTHDRMMAVIQGLTHFNSLVLGHCIKRLGFDVQDTLEFTSPIYRLRLGMIARILAQDPALYADIEIMNPYCKEFIRELEHSTRLFSEVINDGDVSGFARLFSETAGHFGSYSQKALEESNEILQFTQRKLAEKP